MRNYQKGILMKSTCVLIMLILSLLQACQDQRGEQTAQKIDLNQLQPGPRRWDSLSTSQLKTVDFLVATFKEVDPTSREQWIEDFKKDQHPNKELEIWSMMAHAYTTYCRGKNLPVEKKKEVFGLLLIRSAASEANVLKEAKLKYLSVDEAKKVMQDYRLEAKPIMVTEK